VPRESSGQQLLAALTELNARYVDPAGRHIVPDASQAPSAPEE